MIAGLLASGRVIQIEHIETLVGASKLVFIGRVKDIKPSGITTKLSYPGWRDVEFEWLRVQVDILESVKGCEKGDAVQTAMLSVTSTNTPMIDAPGMLDPKKGQLFLFFLLPTIVTNLFASFTAPYDDNLAIFSLDRNYSWYGSNRDKISKDSPSYQQADLIWSLVSDSGQIIPKGVELMRKKYAKEIRALPTNEVIYLQYEKYTNSHGWYSDIPKGSLPGTNAGKN
jgi:hypothetical protein